MSPTRTTLTTATYLPRFVKHESASDRQLTTLALAGDDGEVLVLDRRGRCSDWLLSHEESWPSTTPKYYTSPMKLASRQGSGGGGFLLSVSGSFEKACPWLHHHMPGQPVRIM